MKAGIAASLLVRQVKNSAAWLWDDHPAAMKVLDAAADSNGPAPLGAMLTAHWATVATFVPTDVDARIRHHAWQAMTTPDEVAAGCALVDARAQLDVHKVSARVHDSDRGPLSGHDGEWLSVRAGAIARAAQLGDAALTDQIGSAIDAELEREEAIFHAAKGDARATLTVATILAHNLGDLSRVAADWPRHEALLPYRERWVRLGHPDAPVPRPAFVRAGVLNKAIMAHENHRFLPLRKSRGLRAARALLLPIGPWLDAWGEMIATTALLEDSDRVDVLAALLEVHARDGNQEGCLRAIAGLHRATRGGIERYVPDLPARMRKDALPMTRSAAGALSGRVRDSLDITAAHFAARIEKRLSLVRG